MATLIKLCVLAAATLGIVYEVPKLLPSLNHVAFSVGTQMISWTMVALGVVVGGGFMVLKAK